MKSPKIDPEFRQTVVVPCRFGMHLRVAGRVMQMALKFQSDIDLAYGKLSADAKSVLAIVMMGVTRGRRLVLTARGPDAHQAVQALSELFAAPEILCQEMANRKPEEAR